MKKDWTYKKLGEVAEIKAGFTPSSSELHEAGEYPYYKVSDMNTTGNEVFLISTISYVKQSKKYFPKGSIAFPKNGAAISTNKKRILKYDSIVDLNTGVCIFDSDILPKFGYYWFQNIDFRNYTRGGALPTLDIKTLSLKKIPIPPLSIQRSIVAELDLLHSVISKKKEQLRELDNLAQSLFYQMFGDPITNPMGWEVKKLGEVADFYNGKAHEQEIDELGKFILINSKFIATNASVYKRTAKQLFPLLKEDIVMVMSDVPHGRALAKCYIIKDNDKYSLNQRICAFRNHKQDTTFLYYIINRNSYFIAFDNGNSQTNLRKDDILDCPIILPPLSLQQSFAAKVSAIEAQKQAITQSIHHTEALLAQRMDQYFA